MKNVCAIILAAGDGVRMRSAQSKVLSEVLFKPMISWVSESVTDAGIKNACVVVREGDKRIGSLLPEGFTTVFQSADRAKGYGTGYAVMLAADYIKKGGFSDVAVLCGDAPFVSPGDINNSLRAHRASGNAVTVLAARVDDPSGYGRIIRRGDEVLAIVEQAEADGETKMISEINSGAYWFEADFLLGALGRMTNDNVKNEYYLTDTVGFAVETGRRAGVCVVRPEAVLGANDRKGLAALNRLALEKVLERHMENGVNIPFADGVIIGADAQIGPDTTILPGTIIRGRTVIGSGCEIGPDSRLNDAVIKDNCTVLASYIEDAVVESGVKIGPMSNLRPGAHILEDVKIGDFVEIKNSVVGQKTSVSHLTYIGDASVGKGCNFGCGVVVSNYDGANKPHTEIGDGVFIGGNTNLIAPVRLGDRVYTAAGTTVTEDVPEGALVIGRARQTVKEGWADKKQKFKKAYSAKKEI